ncbi:MAG: PDZ domain-containing protein [Elusimicrobia bacterium]|nr:PDZ domain-containing protein [Elusimicrobiota bacterium]
MSLKAALIPLALLCAATAAERVVGVGLVIKIVGRYPAVESLVPGGPALREGNLKPGDRIEGVAQGDGPWVDTAGLKLEGVVALIRGPRGSSVRLRAVRVEEDGGRRQIVVALKRDVLKDEQGKKR